MPKLAILVLLLELYTQIGFIGALNSFASVSTNGYVEILNSISSLNYNNIFANINTPLTLNGESSVYLFKYLLLISSLLSLIIGTVVGLAQNRIKRLLA